MCVQFLHKLTARALIRDYEDGSLDTDEAEHEVCFMFTTERDQKQAPPERPMFNMAFCFFQGKKVELQRFIMELSKEFSILSQFTSFVAIEERVCAVFGFLHICIIPFS